jgi:hypothetical protein
MISRACRPPRLVTTGVSEERNSYRDGPEKDLGKDKIADAKGHVRRWVSAAANGLETNGVLTVRWTTVALLSDPALSSLEDLHFRLRCFPNTTSTHGLLRLTLLASTFLSLLEQSWLCVLSQLNVDPAFRRAGLANATITPPRII